MSVDAHRAKAIFLEAVGQYEPHQREPYVRDACAGDDELRNRVEVLLHAHAASAGLLDALGTGSGTVPDHAAAEDLLGSSIGPYTLSEVIGEGGMGIVYMAAQIQPVRRRVALKLIKPGMDTRQVIARFEAERQALALMDHPNIARILDAGATESGRPYFVMELVRGIPITEYCDLNRLSLHDRLDLFVLVCQAVHHAHQKGIIHRDLKPSNVLITQHDGNPAPKVIDFGIAKATGQMSLTEKTLYTGFTGLIGTPTYLSPEQAELSGTAIDARSDVYSLGVLLYELLTGKPPLTGSTPLETLALVRDRDPERPSRSNPRVDRDLEAICLKCLEKQPARRYGSAVALADDLERWLGGKPTVARPPGRVGRAWRWCRRNALFAGMTAVIVSLLALAVTALGIGYVRVDRERARVVQGAEALALRSYASDISLARELRRGDDLDNARMILSRNAPPQSEIDRRGFEWYYVSALLDDVPRQRTCYQGHGDVVFHAAFSPDGRTVASGGEDRRIHLWDADSGVVQGVIEGHTADVNWLAFSPDGRRLVSASDDATIRVWDVATLRARSVLHGHEGPVESIAFSPDGRMLVSGGEDGVVRLWNLDEERPRRELRGHAKNVESVAFATDGKSIITGSFDGTVRIWDVAGERDPVVIKASTGLVRAVAITSDGSTVASAGDGEVVVLFDAKSGLPRAVFQAHSGRVHSVCFSPDDRCLVWCGDAGYVETWFWRLQDKRFRFKAQHDLAWSVSFSADGRKLVTTSTDRTVNVWDWPVRSPVQVVAEARGQFAYLAMAPDGRSLVVRESIRRKSSVHGDVERIVLWDCSRHEPIGVVPIPNDDCAAYAWSPDSLSLAFAARNGTLSLWDRTTQQTRSVGPPLVPMPGGWALDAAAITSICFTPDGRQLVLACSDSSIRLLDLPTGKEQLIDRIPTGDRGAQVSRFGGDILAVTSLIRFGYWDQRKQQGLRYVLECQVNIHGCAVHPGLQYAALGMDDGEIKLFRGQPVEQFGSLLSHRGKVVALAFDPTGKTLASGGEDGTVRLWNVATGQQLLILEDRPRAWITGVAFGLEGRMLAVSGTALDDGTTVTLHYADPSLIPERSVRARKGGPGQ